MKSALLLLAISLAAQLAGERSSAAYQLQPISRVFAPTGSAATQSFEVVNDGAERVALTVSFLSLERDDHYVESNRDAEDEFLAYPAQIILAPGARQTVRVSWLGTPNPTRELAYRIIIEQVPIELLDRTAKPEPLPRGQMRILMTYRGTLFIRPPQAAPKISVLTAALAHAPDHSHALAITLGNTGTAVGLVKSCALQITAGGAALALAESSLAALRNTRVLAGGRRRYLLAWPAGVPVGPVKVSGRCAVAN